jgi:hypothetical protein
MSGHGEKLNRKQEQAVAALLAEPTIERAAAAAGVSPRTLKNWLRLPQFKSAYQQARWQILDRNISWLVSLGQTAVAALGKNLNCESPGARNRAADLILTHARAGLETADLLARVEALEAAEKRRQDTAQTATQGVPYGGGNGRA